MKYGKLVYGRINGQGKNQYGNLGDCFQSMAVTNLYRHMGIGKADIVNVKRTEIARYEGEEAVLPMQGFFLHFKGAEIFPVSKKLTSVFFGFHCLSRADRKHIRRLPKDMWIGCRDEPTYRVMKKLGKKAYVSGCLTITLPKREKEPENGKVFLIDAPKGIERYMPQELRDKAVSDTQAFYWDENMPDEETFASLSAAAAERLLKYRDEAALIVTSRLHVAGPCTAMGIPVVLARHYFDERYAWIDKYLPLYTPGWFAEIDWDAKAPDIEAVKELVLNAAAAAIMNAPDSEARFMAVHEHYMSRERGTIKTPLHVKIYHFMLGTFPKTADFVREVLLKRFTVDANR
ncbi:MAG: polysaccharide pyruvyl transferase family protein [Oscillospiraceae bacterium]|nr:polysaccharide pyruvyl transferase family protein [Oscillospiraceae bacterium]